MHFRHPTPLLFINERRFATDFSIHPRKLSWNRRQKSEGLEGKSPTLDFSKRGLACAEFNPA